MQKMNQLADISWNNTAAADGGDERPQFQFTNGWHMFRIHLWSAALSHLKGRPAVHALEIGVHEGQASTWLLLNILSHPSSSLVCVDWWDGDGYDGSEQYVNAKGVRLRHAHNVKATGMGGGRGHAPLRGMQQGCSTSAPQRQGWKKCICVKTNKT